MKTGSSGEYFGPRGMQMGKWRRLQNEQLHSLYHSPDIVRVIKSRILRWRDHIAKDYWKNLVRVGLNFRVP